jgi:hypothetical protein
MTSNPVLQKTLKGILHIEEKDIYKRESLGKNKSQQENK